MLKQQTPPACLDFQHILTNVDFQIQNPTFQTLSILLQNGHCSKKRMGKNSQGSYEYQAEQVLS